MPSKNLDELIKKLESVDLVYQLKAFPRLIQSVPQLEKETISHEVELMKKSTIIILKALQSLGLKELKDQQPHKHLFSLAHQFESNINNPSNIHFGYNKLKLTDLAQKLSFAKLNLELNKDLELQKFGILSQKNKDAELLIENLQGKIAEATKINQKIVASQFGDIFSKKAKGNNTKSWVYFILTILSLIGTIIVAVCLLYESDIPKKEIISIWDFIIHTKVLANLLLISFGIYLIKFFSRLFNNERHLFEINSHRQNALNVHGKMLASVQDKAPNNLETQNVILTHLSKSIFEAQSTAYLKGQNNSPSPMTQIIEMTKTIGSSQ